MRGLRFAFLLASALAPVGAYAQQSVVWEVDSPSTILAGRGCHRDVDAFLSANGDDLSVVFTALGVDLPGNGPNAQLAASSNCAVRIPATIAPGFYIGQLTQRITYGVTKTAGSQVNVQTRSSFFNFGVSPHGVNMPFGSAVNNPLLTTERQDLFAVSTTPSWYSGWCSPSRAPRGFYQANIGVSGNRNSTFEDLIAFVDGLDLKYEVVAALVRCSL